MMNYPKNQQNYPIYWLKLAKNREKGSSLPEVIGSMTIAAVMLSVVSPMLVLASASRLVATRTEKAMEIAQSEIDRVKTKMSQGVFKDDTSGKVPPVTAQNLGAVSAPTEIVSKREDLTDGKLLEIDLDHDGEHDFLVQLFRDDGVSFAGGYFTKNQLASFRMGVRVYAHVAKKNLSSLETEPASIYFTQGLQDHQVKPLAVLYADIFRSDSKLSLKQYQDYLQNNQPGAENDEG